MSEISKYGYNMKGRDAMETSKQFEPKILPYCLDYPIHDCNVSIDWQPICFQMAKIPKDK